MADYGVGKRPKTTDEGDDVNAGLRQRNADLESEIRLVRAELVQLRRASRARLSEGDNEVLPVVVVATVDLSRIDSSIVTQIFSFLGKSRELLNLALTCKSFGWRPPTQLSTLNWSLVEEVARQAVCSTATDDEMSCLPAHSSGATSWLSILQRYEHLLLFDVLMGGCIEYRNGDKRTVRALSNDHYCSAASSYPMTSGAHYAEFEIIAGLPYIGITRPMPGLETGGARSIFPFHHGVIAKFMHANTFLWTEKCSGPIGTMVKIIGIETGKEWKVAGLEIPLGCC
ncbi:hypothetical protein THAOC_12705 [Thalassiosira oceanica]|uniref:F-box domain-containing protein n=1 Tax=Thalassiosira oceanica TaxID=159749 RepID=K0T7D3_THAOC|nr:hypothetical protein THAOC_12705 [Thalassiosira oceanica]|eukprot:EJK66382.1 hypothetical protein THAOC_12705 [Thalassiosira oceanica]